MPTICERKGTKERLYDLVSYLFQNRIIFLDGELTQEQDIQMYIDSPGNW